MARYDDVSPSKDIEKHISTSRGARAQLYNGMEPQCVSSSHKARDDSSVGGQGTRMVREAINSVNYLLTTNQRN